MVLLGVTVIHSRYTHFGTTEPSCTTATDEKEDFEREGDGRTGYVWGSRTGGGSLGEESKRLSGRYSRLPLVCSGTPGRTSTESRPRRGGQTPNSLVG